MLTRLPGWAEILLCAAFSLQLVTIGMMQSRTRLFAWLLLAGLWLLAIRFGHTWLPLSPFVAATIIVLMGARGKSRERSSGANVSEMVGALKIEFLPPRVENHTSNEKDQKEQPQKKKTALRASKKAKPVEEAPPLLNLDLPDEVVAQKVEPVEEKPAPAVAKKATKQAAKKAAKKAARKGKKS